ncbi:MAG: hypothetical protein ACKOQ4_03860, partial [Mycobacterium sp.]
MTDAAFDAVTAGAGPVARGSVARVGVATAVAAVCGYGVMYLAAPRREPRGPMGVRGGGGAGRGGGRAGHAV